MDKPEPSGDEKVVYETRLFEIVKQPMKIGKKNIDFETVRRPPGVRLMIVRDRRMLLTREFRIELDDFDYRLPGGKVFDSLKEYQESKGNILDHAIEAAKKECKEEVGINAKSIKHFHTTSPGATVEWDLFYFIINKFKEGEQQLEKGEVIHPEWRTFEEVKQMCINGDIKEDRTVGVLLRFLS